MSDSGSGGPAGDEPTDGPGAGDPWDEKGTVGNYGGPKDSAEQAKAWFEEQRTMGRDSDVSDNNESSDQDETIALDDDQEYFEDLTAEVALDGDAADADAVASADDVAAADDLGSRSGTEDEIPLHDESEADLASLDVASLDVEPALVDTAHGGIDITGVGTNSQAGRRNVFRRTSDALAFVINVSASQAIVNSGRRFDADYIIVRVEDNRVARRVRRGNSPFSWGRFFWISQGNTWDAANYETPAKWGFGNGLYIFRATIQVRGLSAFATSGDWVFRVR